MIGANSVSIHTPAWGVTDGVRCIIRLNEVSIHTPAWGVTLVYILLDHYTMFQSTLPHGE